MSLGWVSLFRCSCAAAAVLATCCLAARLHAQTVAHPISSAQAVVDTPQQVNERIKEMSAAASRSSSHDYIIGNGDLIDFEVFDVKELSREVRVSQSGTISIPLVPVRIHVAGLTETQAEQKIAEVLEANGLVSNPAVTVSVRDHKSKPITVVGAVGHPMVYQADRQVTLLEVLAEAGGVSNDAGDSVIISRPAPAQFVEVTEPPAIGPESAIANGSATTPGEPPSLDTAKPAQSAAPAANGATANATTPNVAPNGVTPIAKPPAPSNLITVNLNDLVETGDTTNNIPLQAGDIITVPHAGIVYVMGAVTKSGGYILSNDRTEVSTLKILALAGGLTPTAKSDHAVIIRKNEQGQQQSIEVDLKKVLKREAEDVQLLPSDILFVPDSRGKAAMLKAVEIGIAIGTGIALYRVAYH
jgi:polysaccharide export outer membrane protein